MTSPALDFAAMSEYARYQSPLATRRSSAGAKVLPGHLIEIDVDTLQATTRNYEDISARAPPRAPSSTSLDGGDALAVANACSTRRQ